METAQTVTGTEVVAAARAWIGTPFAHQAALRGIACDCIGLVSGVAAELGLPEAARFRSDARFFGYGRLPQPARLLAACREYLDAAMLPDMRLGDVLLMTMLREPMHFGFVSQLRPLRVLHAYQPVGRVVEHCVDAKWKRRVLALYRLRGVR